jgi:hypothetical protein
MSDNAFAYRRSNAFRAVLTAQGARHILIPPYATLERQGGEIPADSGLHREESERVSPDGRRTAAIAEAVLWALLRIATRAE